MPAAAHHRFWANGRSRLTVRITTFPGRPAASLLKRLVSVSHTGVSSDGTALMTLTFPAKSASDTGASPVSTTRKSGALSPALISGPRRVIGFPLNVMIPLRSCMAFPLSAYGMCRHPPPGTGEMPGSPHRTTELAGPFPNTGGRAGHADADRQISAGGGGGIPRGPGLSSLAAPGGPAWRGRHDLFHHPPQFLDLVRFPEPSQETVRGVVGHYRLGGVSAADDHPGVGIHTQQTRARLLSSHPPGDGEVHDDQVERPPFPGGGPVHPDRLASVPGAPYIAFQVFQHADRHVADQVLVVHHEDPPFRGWDGLLFPRPVVGAPLRRCRDVDGRRRPRARFRLHEQVPPVAFHDVVSGRQ